MYQSVGWYKLEMIFSRIINYLIVLENVQILSGSSSFGRASAFQAEGSEFEPRLPLHFPSICLQLKQIKGFHLKAGVAQR